MKCSITGCRNVGEWRYGVCLCFECYDFTEQIYNEKYNPMNHFIDQSRAFAYNMIFITPSKKMIDNRLAILRKQRNEMISTIIKMKNDYELTDDD